MGARCAITCPRFSSVLWGLLALLETRTAHNAGAQLLHPARGVRAQRQCLGQLHDTHLPAVFAGAEHRWHGGNPPREYRGPARQQVTCGPCSIPNHRFGLRRPCRAAHAVPWMRPFPTRRCRRRDADRVPEPRGSARRVREHRPPGGRTVSRLSTRTPPRLSAHLARKPRSRSDSQSISSGICGSSGYRTAAPRSSATACWTNRAVPSRLPHGIRRAPGPKRQPQMFRSLPKSPNSLSVNGFHASTS